MISIKATTPSAMPFSGQRRSEGKLLITRDGGPPMARRGVRVDLVTARATGRVLAEVPDTVRIVDRRPRDGDEGSAGCGEDLLVRMNRITGVQTAIGTGTGTTAIEAIAYDPVSRVPNSHGDPGAFSS